jgi:hypothetical protein
MQNGIPGAGAEKFQVHVQGGVATIEGKTDVVQHDGLAKSGGAVAVANHIGISDAGLDQGCDQPTSTVNALQQRVALLVVAYRIAS